MAPRIVISPMGIVPRNRVLNVYTHMRCMTQCQANDLRMHRISGSDDSTERDEENNIQD
ncbi:hypothetical protein AG1IA_02904 [Rhizoctonia solani AG-1 IA]|uniref:Uncharacterized protein n=1 Tax=Thanatephorus cucumeris (strain AG1-IA) TaxID=983506 RepID=L8X362_THACA|nr:hypothetical protein AG1IA_02904 [Rhizoctonia solani AG-1 IA]